MKRNQQQQDINNFKDYVTQLDIEIIGCAFYVKSDIQQNDQQQINQNQNQIPLFRYENQVAKRKYQYQLAEIQQIKKVKIKQNEINHIQQMRNGASLQNILPQDQFLLNSESASLAYRAQINDLPKEGWKFICCEDTSKIILQSNYELNERKKQQFFSALYDDLTQALWRFKGCTQLFNKFNVLTEEQFTIFCQYDSGIYESLALQYRSSDVIADQNFLMEMFSIPRNVNNQQILTTIQGFIYWFSKGRLRQTESNFRLQTQKQYFLNFTDLRSETEPYYFAKEPKSSELMQKIVQQNPSIEQFLARLQISKNFIFKILIGLLRLNQWLNQFNIQSTWISQFFSLSLYKNASNDINQVPMFESILLHLAQISKRMQRLFLTQNQLDFYQWYTNRIYQNYNLIKVVKLPQEAKFSALKFFINYENKDGVQGRIHQAQELGQMIFGNKDNAHITASDRVYSLKRGNRVQRLTQLLNQDQKNYNSVFSIKKQIDQNKNDYPRGIELVHFCSLTFKLYKKSARTAPPNFYTVQFTLADFEQNNQVQNLDFTICKVLYDFILNKIQSTLENYADEEEFDFDQGSLNIQRINIFSIPLERHVQQGAILKYKRAGFTQIRVGDKQVVQNSLYYKQSLHPKFKDFDSQSCLLNVFAFILHYSEHQDQMFTEDFVIQQQLNSEWMALVDHSAMEIQTAFELIQKKHKDVGLYYYDSNSVYGVQKLVGNLIFITVSHGHCWVSSLEQMKKMYEKPTQKNRIHQVYSLQPPKQRQPKKKNKVHKEFKGKKQIKIGQFFEESAAEENEHGYCESLSEEIGELCDSDASQDSEREEEQKIEDSGDEAYSSEEEEESRKKKKKKVEKRNPKCAHVSKIFYDIETVRQPQTGLMIPVLLCCDVSVHTLRVKGEGGYHREEKKVFFGLDCIVNFVDLLAELDAALNDVLSEFQKTKVYIYGHNSNRFDNLFLEPFLLLAFSTSFHLIGSIGSIKYMEAGKSLVFRDMIDLLPGKLEDLCVTFNTKDRKMKFKKQSISFKKLESQKYRDNLIKYCQMDVEVLKQLYFAFLKTLMDTIPNFQEKDIKATLPSTSLNLMGKFFFKNYKIYGNPSNSRGLEVQFFERESYYGGYTQVMKHKLSSSVCYWDFVSMYVSCLWSEKIPYSQGVIDRNSGQFIREDQSSQTDFFQDSVLYQISEFSFGEKTIITNLPVRNKKSKVTIYPLNFKKGDAEQPYIYLWGRELNLAVDLGLKYLFFCSTVTYEKHVNCFKEYMEFWFEIKKTSKQLKEDAKASIAKLFGNSFYGKLGQRHEGTKQFMSIQECQDIGVQGIVDLNMSPAEMKNCVRKSEYMEKVKQPLKGIRQLNDQIVELDFEPDTGNLNFSGSLIRIATFTTMVARCRLLRLMLRIGPENIYYCDTDSIVFDKKFVDRIPPEMIGEEMCQIADQFPNNNILQSDFLSAKCYYCLLQNKYKGHRNYIKFKGIRKPKLAQVQELRIRGKKELTQEQWKREWGNVTVDDVLKRQTLRTKRRVEQNGNTFPFKDFKEYEFYYQYQIIRKVKIGNQLCPIQMYTHYNKQDFRMVYEDLKEEEEMNE